MTAEHTEPKAPTFRISWGTKIALLYSGFVVMIVTLVIATFYNKSELVADDYYQQEVSFQQRLNATLAASGLQQPVSLEASATQVTLRLPQSFNGKSVEADIHFYAPANAAADRRFKQTISFNEMVFDRISLEKAFYEVRVSWTADHVSYYQALPLNLQ